MDATICLEELLTPQQVEERYKIARNTQKHYRWRARRGHPDFKDFPYLKIGRAVRYRPRELESWIANQSKQAISALTETEKSRKNEST